MREGWFFFWVLIGAIAIYKLDELIAFIVGF